MMATVGAFIGSVNIGNLGEFTAFKLARQVLKLTGSKSKIRFLRLPVDGARQRQLNMHWPNKNLDGSPNLR
jgi:UDP-glucuronate decarboxylase